jgi:5-methylcytosine-specific restriction protein B
MHVQLEWLHPDVAHRLEAGDTKNWFQQVVETEIGPLLDEYWFDAPDEAQQACARLLQNW